MESFRGKNLGMSMTTEMPYTKSAQCSLAIRETADVVIAIETKLVAWGFYSIDETPNRPVMIWSGEPLPGTPFSASPVEFFKSTLSVHGFSVQTGVGPVHSGHLQIDLFLWATDDTKEIALSTDRSVEVQFRFGTQDWARIGGTPFQWPSAT